MKKQYTKPSALFEVFEANTSVAACYQIACTINGRNTMDQGSWTGPERSTREEGGIDKLVHSPGTGGCHDASVNFILDDDGVATVGTPIFEMSSAQGKIYGEVCNVSADGKTVFWSTYDADRSRRWNHVGTVGPVDPTHPNRS